VRYTEIGPSVRMGRVAVGITTYNGAHRVANLLQSMRGVGSSQDYVITLLDDGSTRGDQQGLLSALAVNYRTNFIRHHANEGITKSWNDLVRFVDSEFSVLLNDDIIVQPRWIENLVYFLEHNPCGAASPKILFCNDEDVPRLLAGETVTSRNPNSRLPDPSLDSQDNEEAPGVVMCALGCSFGFRRSVFDQLGGFDERTRNFYNESWLGTKAARDLKLPSYCIPAPRIWHLWSATFNSNPELRPDIRPDRAAYISEFGGDFQGPNGTHPRFMHGTMPARLVKWIGPDGQPRERELTVQ
jgi:GT2 family glycosyltransferase